MDYNTKSSKGFDFNKPDIVSSEISIWAVLTVNFELFLIRSNYMFSNKGNDYKSYLTAFTLGIGYFLI